ncbi:hypothetical protein OP10G_2685 [Fimbriimonas ginsengisoli Gsoil 348]|uniref:Rv2525c-like glycoside hydrolase-like domain-containing protein n=2 Tax=Fimbriimonas ginsengisoli TaxID=1005039 RepID=A0A068NRB9_FIMGI|nr:hypothetical protein OP10G_2685 [Fimbriimonas ginsengisoli Gsoil 348]
MRTWKAHSPYEWVGYYLGGPCHSDHSWRGKRAFIEELGFHILPVFVGNQGGTGCGHGNLTPARGAQDGKDAVAAMAADGFPHLRYVYLDVEPVDVVTSVQQDYIRAWIESVLQDARYLPAMYLHRKNADVLRNILTQELHAHGHHAPARMWVCGGPASFSINDVPGRSTVPDAFAWQGELDTNHTFGGVTIHIDQSVSLTPTPGE